MKQSGQNRGVVKLRITKDVLKKKGKRKMGFCGYRRNL